MRKILTILVFLLTCGPSSGQTKCEEIDKDIKKGFDSFAKWQFEAIKKKKFVLADSVFKIAEYMRHKSDTSYKTWYNKFIDLAKSKQKKNTSHRYFDMGKAYFYTDNLDKAEHCFKCANMGCFMGPCIDYYKDLINQRRKNNS
jgi:hypothetical protein